MIYSSRFKKILHYCLTHRDIYVTLDELADLLKISKRTIFRELKDVDLDLANYQLQLDNKSGKGLRILGSKVCMDELFDELQTQGIEYINKEERAHLLKFELLHNNELTKLMHYAHLFQVSEATISNDFDTMLPWFEHYHLTLQRTPGLGIEVVGNEADVRRAMSDVLHESLQKRDYNGVNYFDSQMLLDQIFMKDDQGSILRLLNQDILERILQVFQDYRHELNLDRYVQSSYIGLMIHLVIAIERILKKEEIVDNEHIVTMVQDDDSFIQAKNMVDFLEVEFDIDIPTTEVAFIALHIKGAKINNTSYNEEEHVEYDKLSSLISTMLLCYDEEIRIQLVQDKELLHGLLTHLEPTIIRLKNQLPIYNPLLSQIKEMYSELYEQTKRACVALQEAYACDVSEDEVGFITMHIGASLERMKQTLIHKRDVTIGVVCASGIGVSALLSARIQKVFPFGVVLHVLSMEDILNHQYDQCELLISTFPLHDTSVKVFCVSPLLISEDIARIRYEVDELAIKEVPHSTNTQQDFIQTMKCINVLSRDIIELIDHIYISSEEFVDCSMDVMQNIAITHGKNQQGQQQLLKDLEKREQMGSVIMSDYGFVLFHTISDGVAHTVLHLYYPKAESFAYGEHDNMKFVLALILPHDHDEQKQTLMALLSRSLIDHEAFYKAVCNRDKHVIKERVCEILHDYMVTYLEEHV